MGPTVVQLGLGSIAASLIANQHVRSSGVVGIVPATLVGLGLVLRRGELMLGSNRRDPAGGCLEP